MNARNWASPIIVLTGLLCMTSQLAGQPAPAVLGNRNIKVTFDPAKRSFAAVSLAQSKAFLVDATFADSTSDWVLKQITDPVLGEGTMLQIPRLDGGHNNLSLFGDFPFVFIQSTIRNPGAQASTINKIPLISGSIDLGKSPQSLKTLGTGGLTGAESSVGSYAWLAVADPQTRNGVVSGWLTHDRASGVVFSKGDYQRVHIDARGEYGRLQMAPGGELQTETFIIGYFDDARLGLEAWADTVAKVYRIHLHPQPLGYCTWYSDKHGHASDQMAIAQLADFAARELKPYGFNFVQIDDGWQLGEKTNGPKKNFTGYNPAGPYRAGMKATVDHLKSLGFTPGLWFMPFAGNLSDPFFKDHLDWFARTEDGKPYDVNWGGTCLDMSNPAAREYLRGVVSRMAHDWGFTYFKMDGLFTGTASRQEYVNAGYKDDHFGESILHDATVSHVQAYREGLKLVRQVAGDDVFLLGCCAPQNMRSYAGAFGLLDAMRIGPDNSAKWPNLKRGPEFGSRNYFLHGRIWYNDPDPLYVRASLPLNEAQLIASWVTISGQLSSDSDWLPDLPSERLNILRRTMPSHGLLPRPVDLFEHDLPQIWLLTDMRRSVRRDVVAIYNWEDVPADMECSIAQLGLDPDNAYVGFDFWANEPVPAFKGILRATLPPHSCRVIAVRPQLDRPMLISTSRHITQGIVDVLEEKWDEPNKTLSGRSLVVGGDPYELRIVVGTNTSAWIANNANLSEADRAAGVAIEPRPSTDGVTRIRIRSATSRQVAWSVHFSAGGKAP